MKQTEGGHRRYLSGREREPPTHPRLDPPRSVRHRGRRAGRQIGAPKLAAALVSLRQALEHDLDRRGPFSPLPLAMPSRTLPISAASDAIPSPKLPTFLVAAARFSLTACVPLLVGSGTPRTRFRAREPRAQPLPQRQPARCRRRAPVPAPSWPRGRRCCPRSLRLRGRSSWRERPRPGRTSSVIRAAPAVAGRLALRLVARLPAVAVARWSPSWSLPARELPSGERLVLELDRDLPLVDEFSFGSVLVLGHVRPSSKGRLVPFSVPKKSKAKRARRPARRLLPGLLGAHAAGQNTAPGEVRRQ